MKNVVTSLFFELIRVALGRQTALSVSPGADEWRGLFHLAQQQTLIGICFSGIERLPAEQRPPRALLMQWFGLTHQIEERNIVMNERTKEATRFFRSHGFKTWVLKGQGMAQLYPNPNRRQSGDIDIWLAASRKDIYDFALEQCGKLEGVNYHHIHYPLFDDTEVEVHIYPGYLYNPMLNRRLHKFFRQHLPTEEPIPSMAFNRIFILQHTYNHLTGHGVGLRQVMDYYYVLLQGFSHEEQRETINVLKRLGMLRFASAVMWVMQEVFGLERERMLVGTDELEGRFLLEEIFQTGNMGHYEQRHWGSLRTPVSRFFYNLRRDWHLVSHYPQEVCWQPLFSLWLNVRRYFWKRTGGNEGRKTNNDNPNPNE